MGKIEGQVGGNKASVIANLVENSWDQLKRDEKEMVSDHISLNITLVPFLSVVAYYVLPKHEHNCTLRHKNSHHSGGKEELRQDIAIEMALPLIIANEIRCISHVRSRTSPLTDAMQPPKLRRRTSVDLPNTPDVPTTIGWKSNLSVWDAYLTCRTLRMSRLQ